MSAQKRWRDYADAMNKVTGGTCPNDLIEAAMSVADKELCAQRTVLLGAAGLKERPDLKVAPSDAATDIGPADGPANESGPSVATSARGAEAIRAAVCMGDCGLAEEECAKVHIQPVAWLRGSLHIVEGTPEMLAAAALASVDRSSAVREALAHVRSLPVDCTALTGPVWYGDGWKSALDEVEDFADRLYGQGEPESVPISSEELARRLNEGDVWWTKGITPTWEKLPESLGKSRYRAIAHRMMKELFITRRTDNEENNRV